MEPAISCCLRWNCWRSWQLWSPRPGFVLYATTVSGRAGWYSIRINDQWRLCFRYIDGDAYDAETVYH